MSCFDTIAEKDADDTLRVWVRRLLDAKDDIVAFVDARLQGGGSARYLGWKKGSFNLAFHIGLANQPSVLIRFPKPGHTVSQWREEKVMNEVHVIEYLREHTTIPLPHIRCWGLTDESPAQLGPFIIMDYIEGTNLGTFIRQPAEDKDAELVLDPDIDDAKLDAIYEQVADFLIQISRLEFPRIGAITKDELSGTWSVVNRPLTYVMNELVTIAGYPVDQLPSAPFDTASDFFETAACQHLIHLNTQRNLVQEESNAKKRFIARHRFRQLIPEFCIEDGGPFRLYCDDLRPTNMLIDPKTLRITAVIDFEFTNSMPAQFSYDPPWWLLLRGPDLWLDDGCLDEFLVKYAPRMEQFLKAVKRVEKTSPSKRDEPPLSDRMRDSWESRRFWFDYAARMPLDVDEIYWKTLHQNTDESGIAVIESERKQDIESLTRHKMAQLKAYQEERAVRLAKEETN